MEIFFLRKSDSLKPNSSQSPTKTSLKQGQLKEDRKTKKTLERKKSKTVDGVQEKTIQTAEAKVRLTKPNDHLKLELSGA